MGLTFLCVSTKHHSQSPDVNQAGHLLIRWIVNVVRCVCDLDQFKKGSAASRFWVFYYLNADRFACMRWEWWRHAKTQLAADCWCAWGSVICLEWVVAARKDFSG